MIEPREEIQQLKAYKPPLDERYGKYRYDFNENVLGASPKAIQAIREMDPVKISTYPEYEEYYQKIAQHFNLKAENIFLSNGTDEAIKMILETYMSKGDEMVLPIPTFAMFTFYASRIGIDIKEVLYNDDLSFPTTRVLNSITQTTRVVVLVNPNNPTGTPILQEDIERIVQKASHALVIIDEAYYDFAERDSLHLLDKYDNIIILRTFSKSIGLAGLRVGIAISQPSTIAVLEKSSSPYNVSTIGCHAAVAALEDEEFSKLYITQVKTSRELVTATLQKWGYRVYPSSANFILVDFGYQSSWIIRYLRKLDILVRDRSNYPLLDNCVRITMGSEEDASRLLDAIDQARSIPPLIFDMDGVLVDVSQSYRKAIAKTAEVFTGSLPSMTEIQEIKNEGGYNNDWKLTQELIRRSGKQIELDEITDVFQSYYLGTDDIPGLIDKETWLLDLEYLSQINKNHPIYIYTGRPREEAIRALEVSGTQQFFDGLITMDEIPKDRGKPDPWGLQQFLKHYKIEQAYYFGDTVDDMKAAKAANITPIGIIPPNIDNNIGKVLRDAGADKVISISQLQEVLS